MRSKFTMTSYHEQKPHFALFPFMAQGHLIPTIDIARVLATRGVRVTILTTPLNGNRIEPVISRSAASGLTINVVHLEFPCLQVGLPLGHESIDMNRSHDDARKFFQACCMLKEPLRASLQELKPLPNCLVSDMCFPWTTDLARELRIPRLVFHGTSCFSLLCMHVLGTLQNFQKYIASDNEYFVVPGLPHRIEMTLSQLKGNSNKVSSEWIRFREDVLRSNVESFGTIANTFQELEGDYVNEYKRVTGNNVWCIGPVSLCNKDDLDKVQRGEKASINEGKCLNWLDSKSPSSVIYICLGSVARLSTSQLVELGLALEKSSHPFIWVIKDASDEFQKWILEEKFEEKIKDRGVLIRGWAPQVLILSHSSIGGFLTHCGWNSTLEGITYGIPMLTWPVLGEQFCNERFVVNVIETGVRAGVELPVNFEEEEEDEDEDEERVEVQLKSEEINKAINRLMDKGEEGDERRERAKTLARTAKISVEESGSSYFNVGILIQDVMKQYNF